MSTKPPWTLDRIVKAIIALTILGFLFWLVAKLSDVLIPFGIAFLAAYILNPIVKKIELKLKSRPLAVAIVLIALFVFVTTALWLLIPLIQNEAVRAADLLKRTIYDASVSEQAIQWMPESIWQKLRSYLGSLKFIDLVEQKDTLSVIGGAISNLLPRAFSILSGTLNFLLWILGFTIILLYLVFLLLDYDLFVKQSQELIPTVIRSDILEFIKLFDQAMSQYFRAQALVAFTVGVMFSIGFSIIGLPLAIVFGLFVGLLNMVPYLQIASIPLAAILAILHAFDTNTSIGQILFLVVLVYAIVQIIQDGFLVPKIMGNITGLSPVMVLLSLSVWGKLLGFFGLIVAIPFTCLVLAYYRKAIHKDVRQRHI
ncbi:MAG: AI-2E family transporter [Fibrobacter sp.]|nr:AI-2E family transporter [Fibrobacter sp.]